MAGLLMIAANAVIIPGAVAILLSMGDDGVIGTGSGQMSVSELPALKTTKPGAVGNDLHKVQPPVSIHDRGFGVEGDDDDVNENVRDGTVTSKKLGKVSRVSIHDRGYGVKGDDRGSSVVNVFNRKLKAPQMSITDDGDIVCFMISGMGCSVHNSRASSYSSWAIRNIINKCDVKQNQGVKAITSSRFRSNPSFDTKFIKGLVADAEEVLKDSKKKLVIIGHSYGGFSACGLVSKLKPELRGRVMLATLGSIYVPKMRYGAGLGERHYMFYADVALSTNKLTEPGPKRTHHDLIQNVYWISHGNEDTRKTLFGTNKQWQIHNSYSYIGDYIVEKGVLYSDPNEEKKEEPVNNEKEGKVADENKEDDPVEGAAAGKDAELAANLRGEEPSKNAKGDKGDPARFGQGEATEEKPANVGTGDNIQEQQAGRQSGEHGRVIWPVLGDKKKNIENATPGPLSKP